MSDNAAQKFQTYLFFLRHFDRLIRLSRNDVTPAHLLTALVDEQDALLTTIQPLNLTPPLANTIRKMLFNAWNSETVARLNSLFEVDIRVITNQWKPVQMYYALYFLLAAVHELHVPGHKQGHENTLRHSTLSVGHRFPRPWCCHYDFDENICHHLPWQNLPPVQSGWNLANHEDAHLFVAHFYRTTGIEKWQDRWLDHGKGKKHKTGPRAGKRIFKAEIKAGVIGCWDVLWRMRKWVNYKEAQALLEGQEYLPHVEEFDAALNSILTASATVIEHLLHALLGDALMTGLYNDYLDATAGKVDCAWLVMRRDIICG